MFVFELDEELSEGDLVAVRATALDGKVLELWSEVELKGRTVTLRQFSIYGVGLIPG